MSVLSGRSLVQEMWYSLLLVGWSFARLSYIYCQVRVEGIRASQPQDELPCDIHARACCFVDAEVNNTLLMFAR